MPAYKQRPDYKKFVYKIMGCWKAF